MPGVLRALGILIYRFLLRIVSRSAHRGQGGRRPSLFFLRHPAFNHRVGLILVVSASTSGTVAVRAYSLLEPGAGDYPAFQYRMLVGVRGGRWSLEPFLCRLTLYLSTTSPSRAIKAVGAE